MKNTVVIFFTEDDENSVVTQDDGIGIGQQYLIF